MSNVDKMGLSIEAAQGYEQFFIPAIFHQWPAQLIAAGNINEDDDALDVGCGTGALTRRLAEQITLEGSVTGLDLSDSMLAVARRICPAAHFQQGDVCAMPFSDNAFDVVLGQFMLMFVPDPALALLEVQRVLRPGGRVVMSVWQGLDNNPVYQDLVAATREIVDDEAADSLAWPFIMGDPHKLENLFASAGLHDVTVSAHDGTAKFPSLESFVRTEVQAWLLADRVSNTQTAMITRQLRNSCAEISSAAETINFPLNAYLITATIS